MKQDTIPGETDADAFLQRCASIDLEVDPATSRIQSFAAVRQDSRQPFVFKGGALDDALETLTRYCDTAEFLLGHNFINFDAGHLRTSMANTRLLTKPIVDTLWLNPLAHPGNPYHKLVKHYKDGGLCRDHVSDPELDAKLVLDVLADQFWQFRKSSPETVEAYHFLTTVRPEHAGFDAFFAYVRGHNRPGPERAHEIVRNLLRGKACDRQIDAIMPDAHSDGWPLAYALAFISVAGGSSIMPPWVRYQFPEAHCRVQRLRDTPCPDPDCPWCRREHDLGNLLKRWFDFDKFRPSPVHSDGKPLQETITTAAMNKDSVLGILPTGTGKSLCYQLPALAKYTRTGALTVVISPLVALMADQVKGMEQRGRTLCVTINGTLSMPERRDALDKVRLGEAAILIISPEQLRSVSVRSVLEQRTIGYWILDEAHCISKWGHDFRPDYRYVGRFIKEFSGGERPAPILCLTATAKPDVIRDIKAHFDDRIGVRLKDFNGGSVRENLTFKVTRTARDHKLGDILSTVNHVLPAEGVSGAIIYRSTRAATERTAAFLRESGFASAHYHAGMKPEEKKEVQEQFSAGTLRIIAATNAFGMGIDKPDIRLVVHADIPGSLENYLQEAGRAGRDGKSAQCILLYTPDDVEHQFSLSVRTKLEKREIGAILKSLRRLNGRLNKHPGTENEVVVTAGEIVREDREHRFDRDSMTEDTRVKTALSWLEEARLIQREENRVNIFPSSLRIRTRGAAEEILARADIPPVTRRRLLSVVCQMLSAPPDRGMSTDELCSATGLTPGILRKTLHDLESHGIASNDTAITILVHAGVQDSSRNRLKEVCSLEKNLIAKLHELAPDLDPGTPSILNLRIASQALRDAGHGTVRPDIVEKLIRGIAQDGRDEDEGTGSFQVRKLDRERMSVRLRRSWEALAMTVERRHLGASVLLGELLKSAPTGTRGKDILVESTHGKLMKAIGDDMELSHEVKDRQKLLDRALLWLHEQDVVKLGKGLTIFRSAMTIRLKPGVGQFVEADFEKLKRHYQEQILQTHIMAEYAERGLLKSMSEASRLAKDYFSHPRDAFLQKWLPDRSDAELGRPSTSRSWEEIVGSLKNPSQSDIVSDDRVQTNVLVLAGPGSGKTRVLVHRIAYLIRIKRQSPASILALVYNRHAATEIRRRLFELIGNDARGITVTTCHGFAMRMIGASFVNQSRRADAADFDRIMQGAVELLQGEGLARDESQAQRETLIEGYRWILVDEYQDIGPKEYELIKAIAGRSIEDEEQQLSLFAVGDDDQNIYAFRGASVQFIRRFETDYRARPDHLLENYRSSGAIIRAANRLIAPVAERMKADHDIIVNTARTHDPDGGDLAHLDALGRGRVQILRAENHLTQAVAAVDELQRISRIDPKWDWARTAIIAREWKYLQPVRSCCEARGIPVQLASEKPLNFWRLRETQTFVRWLQNRDRAGLRASDLETWITGRPEGPWWAILRGGIEEFVQDIGKRETDRHHVCEWLAEWGREIRNQQENLLLLTAHSAKGREFDHVVVLDGGWGKTSRHEDRDATRRLYYVAMTRAKCSLALVTLSTPHPIANFENDEMVHFQQPRQSPVDVSECQKHYMILGPEMVNLGYAGRLMDNHPAHRALKAIAAGDPLHRVQREKSWFMTTRDGVRVCKLARRYAENNVCTPENGYRFVRGSVHAIIARFREDSPEAQREHLKRDAWDIVIPELVFEKC